MSVVAMMLGLKPVDLPEEKKTLQQEKSTTRNYDHLRVINHDRKEKALNNLKKILRDLVMSTSDISKRLRIDRASVSKYMSDLEKGGIVERVGETVHPDERARVMVWRFTKEFLSEEMKNG